MKWLSKINRGAILTAAVLTGVVLYLVILSIIQGSQKPVISQICRDYIVAEIKYSMLPEDQRIDDPDMTESELNAFLDQMETDISAFFPPEEQFRKYAISSKRADLTAQSQGFGIVYSYSKSIVRFTNFLFDKNTVIVSFIADTSIEASMTGITGLPEKIKLVEETTDQIILFKVDDQWKVIYANILKPGRNFVGNPGVKG